MARDAIILMTDGSTRKAFPKNGLDFKCEELNEIVDGWIEIVDLGDSYMVVNEEGKIRGFAYNEKATNILHKKCPLMCGDYIAGNALVCRKEQIK